MSLRFAISLLAAVLLLAVTACGSDVPADDDTVAPTSSGLEAESEEAPDSDITTETTSTTTEALPDDPTDLGGLALIEVTSQIDDLGNRPLLAWTDSDGAARYELIVVDSAGDGYWAWRGIGTQVWFGGSSEEPPEGSPGPTLYEPMTLTVLALDADGRIIAASPPTPMNP